MDQNNEQSEAFSAHNSSTECQPLKNEEHQLEVNRTSCTSALEVEGEITVGDDGNEINSSINKCILNDNTGGFEAAPPLVLAKQKVTDNEQKTEGPQQIENRAHVVINRKSEALHGLAAYGGATDSDDSDIEISSNDVTGPSPVNNQITSGQAWRTNEKDHSDTCDSDSDSTRSTLSSDSESESDSESSDSDQKLNNSCRDKATVGIASRNEIKSVPPVGDTGAVKRTSEQAATKEILPPIPDLSKININKEEEFIHLGELKAIVETLVTIESMPNKPAFDLDSMLFIGDSQKKPLGPIFDVLGPVLQPIYCVRFNTEDEIKASGIMPGMKVYAAPKSDEFSKFVFLTDLLQIKGSDASGWYDQEMPAELSDDEQEFQTNRANQPRGKRKLLDNSAERHRRYEKTMNQSNTFDTKVHNLVDGRKKSGRPRRSNATATFQSHTVPQFNPAVPPPGYTQHSSFGFNAPQFEVPTRFPTGTTANFQANYAPVFNRTPQFGSFDPNITSPYLMGPPLTWPNSQNSSGQQFSQGPEDLQRQYNYFTNNSRNSNDTDPGPSSQF